MPHRHSVTLNSRIGFLAAHAFLGQRQKYALRMDEATQPVKVALHVLRINQQLVDDAGQAFQCKVEMDGGIGANATFDGGMRDIALVPQRHVLKGRHHRRAHQAGKARQVLGQHRIALVRHGARALLAGREIFLDLQNLGALQVADFGGQPLDRAGDDGQGREKHRMAVARDDLRRDRLHRQTELCRHMFLNARVNVGEGTDGA